MGLSLSGKTEFQAGHPWKNPEERLTSSKFDPDYKVPHEPLTRPYFDPNPLHKQPQSTSLEFHQAAISRALNTNCIMSTLDFMKYPVLIGLFWGATLASNDVKKDASEYTSRIVSGWTEAGRGLSRELKFLRTPVLYLGGFAGLFRLVDCSVASWRGYDGISNTSIAGLVTGTAIGLAHKSPNRMFTLGFWGAAFGAIGKWALLSDNLKRPSLTYFELKDYRMNSVRPEYAKKMSKDGYMHEWLDPQLEKLGIAIPEDWKSSSS